MYEDVQDRRKEVCKKFHCTAIGELAPYMATDYLLHNDDDLLFANGDLVVGDSDAQHIRDTINAYPGWWKEFPADGVGVRSYLNSSGQQQQLAREIKIQLQSDGYEVSPNPTIDTSTGKMVINPNARRL